MFTGYFDRGNLGDELMMLGWRQIFDENGVTVSFRRYPNWRALPVLEILRYIRQVFKADVLAIGGTQLFDTPGYKWHLYLTMKLALVFLARACGTRVIYAGIGIGPIKTSIGRSLIKGMLLLSDAAYVRDKESADLAAILSTRLKIVSGPDIAFVLPPTSSSRDVGTATPVLGVSLLPFFASYQQTPSSDETLAHNLSAAIAALSPRPIVKLLAFSLTARSDDRTILEIVCNHLCADRIDFEMIECKNVATAIKEIAVCDGVIGMRYHSVVLSALSGVPVAAVTYAEKCYSLVKQLDLNYTIAPTDLLSQSVASEFVSQFWMNKRVDCTEQKLQALSSLAKKAGSEMLGCVSFSQTKSKMMPKTTKVRPNNAPKDKAYDAPEDA
jgi:polysaccharide pyruvyl transferase WcaK-like protein